MNVTVGDNKVYVVKQFEASEWSDYTVEKFAFIQISYGVYKLN